MNLTGHSNLNEVEASKLPRIGLFNSTMVRTVMNMVKKFVRKSNSTALHPCPMINGDLSVFNVSSYIKHDFETIMPDGDYRYEHMYWNDEDELVYKKTVFERFKTMEESFF